jgi:hypothetical protein
LHHAPCSVLAVQVPLPAKIINPEPVSAYE